MRALPSGLLGCLLLLGLPYIFYIRLIRMDKDWQLDLCSEVLSRPSILSITLVNALARAGFAMREWHYSDILAKMRAVAEVAFVSGLMTGLLLNARNDLLRTPLCSDVVIGFLRKTTWTALILCSTSVLCSSALAWLYHGPTGRLDMTHVMKVLYALGDVPEFFQLMTLTFLVSRISASARQLMLEVTVVMPCDAKDFPKQVHAPCSRVLRDSTPKLSTCGLPLVLVASKILMACFSWYGMVQLLAVSEVNRGFKDNWLHLLLASCQLGAILLAVVAGPFQLSAALTDLENKLNEERHRDGGMHLEVQAVEAMLAKQNNGQGWGIPVFEGFILSKAVLQTIFIRLALAGTVIKTFLDCELGFEKEQTEALQPDLAELKGMLRNMTMLPVRNAIDITARCISATRQSIWNLEPVYPCGARNERASRARFASVILVVTWPSMI